MDTVEAPFLHRDDRAVDQIAQAVGRRFNQKNRGFRSNRVRPFHVERDFHCPVRVRDGLLSIRIDLAEAAVAAGASRQTELRAEDAEIGFRVDVVVRVHDADRLPGSLIRHLVKPIGVAHLRGSERRSRRAGWRARWRCIARRIDRIVRAHEADGIFTAFGEARQVGDHVLRVERLAERQRGG